MRLSFSRVALGLGLAATIIFLQSGSTAAQEKSVRPGINKQFKNPDVKEFLGKFEVESREPFAHRKDILAACRLKPGMTMADVGAGTGLFTRLFAEAVGPKGRVYAVDIAPNFIRYIEQTCKEKGLQNVVGVLCKPDSVELPPNSIDLAFTCDTYHHFEFPFRTLQSIHRALKPGGQLIVIDFKRIKGVTSDWIMYHVRAGQETVTREILDSGFRLVDEDKNLKENYFLRFQKVEAAKGKDVAPGR